MEGRTGLPVSGTPPFPAPVPPPHGTVPTPVVVSSDTVLSPVFADLPAGPNTNTRTSTGSAATSITSPGHANYQGKLFSSSVAGGGSCFSYLDGYASPSGSDSFKQSAVIVGQSVSMNQYWIPSSEGYTGYPVGGAHPYQPYFTALNSLTGSGSQGLLAVSSTAKTDGQRIPASHHTRNSDIWEGPASKVTKTSPHGPKEGALSPKTISHPTGKARHPSGSEDRKVSKHDSSRSKTKDKQKYNAISEEITVNRSSKINPKDRGSVCDASSKHEQKLESDFSQDSQSRKSERSPAMKNRPSNPLTVCVDVNSAEESNCNGDSVQSPRKDCAKMIPSASTSSPKSKDTGSDKRKKASKKKDVSVDVNGNAVLSSGSTIGDKKPSILTSDEKLQPSGMRIVLDTLSAKEAISVSTHSPAGTDPVDKIHPRLTDLSTNGNNWSSVTNLTVLPVVSSPTSVPLSGKLSPSSVSRQVLASTALSSTSPGLSGTCSSAVSNQPGTSSGAVMVQMSSPGVSVSTTTPESLQGLCSKEDAPTMGVNTMKLNPSMDHPMSLPSPGLLPSDTCQQKASPVGAGLAVSKTPALSPLGLSTGTNAALSTELNPKGVNPNGDNPFGVLPVMTDNPKRSSPVGATLTRESPLRINPLDVRTTDGSITGACPTSSNPSIANPIAAYPTEANQARLSPTDTKPSKSSPVMNTSVAICSPNSSEPTDVSPTEKEKGSKSLVSMATFNTCVTSSVSKPISFSAHGSLPSPSSQSQPSYINHLPIYLHGTGHLSLEREVGREAPRDGSKVHATTFVPALGEFIPGPASSATMPVKEPKVRASSGKESNLGQAANEKDKERALKKEVAKVVSTSSKDQAVGLPKFDVTNDKTKVGLPHQEGGTKSKESMDVKSTLTKGKGDKIDKHDKSKKMHSSSKAAHESRDHHLSPSELSSSGKERGTDGPHRTSSDLIHRETCRTSDAAIISTTPSVHSFPHHMSGFVVPLSSMVSSRDGGKHDAPSSPYSSEEQRRYMEWHLAATKRGYCYDHSTIRGSGQEPLKVDSTLMQRTPHQPSFPSPRTESRSELTPEYCRGRDFPPYTAPQESMLRSVLTAGMLQAHSDTQRTSPGSSSSSSSSKPSKQTSEPKPESRTKSASHSGKSSSDNLGSQGRSTPGTKGSDGRNPPVGIAVAQKRQDSESVNQARPSMMSTSRNSPHVALEEAEDRGARSRALHGVERDVKHRDHSPRSQREVAELLPPTKYHHHRYAGELGSNLIVTGGTGLGHSPHHFDPADGCITPSHPAHLAIPPHWLPRAPGQPHAQPLWLGHPFGLTAAPTASLHVGESASGHLQIPPAGFQVARDPATGQLVLVPQAPAMHSDSAVPPNLSMWPYLVPPHLQPHSHQLQQLVLNQPSFASPLPHGASHPLTHRPDQPLPNTDYHFALQQQQEALAQWYRQDEQHQREEHRRREQQSRKGSGEKVSSDKSHKTGSGGETKVDSHPEKPAVAHDILNLKIPPPAPYLPGVPLPGQPPVPYVYPPQQVQYLYNPTGVFPGPAVSCNSSPRTESGASTASPKQTTSKSATNSEGIKMSKLESNLKTALKSISVQTSPSETPASVDYSDEMKLLTVAEDEKEDKEISVRTDDSEDQELIIVDVVDDDVGDNLILQSEKFTQESKETTPTYSEAETVVFESKPVEEARTNVLSSLPQLSTDVASDINMDPAVTQRSVTETVLPIAPLNTPPLDNSLPPPEAPALQEEPSKESLISNVLTTTQSFASRMEALDQDQLAAIEGIALLSEVADQKAFSICSDSDRSSAVQNSQTRDDSYLLDNRHQDNGTPLQGNTASAVTSASGVALQLISQSCPTSPTDFIFKRNASSDGVDTFASPEQMMNPNEVEMRQRMAELQRKYQEKKRELDKLQRKKDKKDKGSRSLKQDRQQGPGRPRKRKISKESHNETRPCPIIKSSTAVLLEAAASLEECSLFLAPKKKKKKDREDKEKGKTEEKKKSSRKDKEAKSSHSETSKSKKRKHKLKDEMQESSMLSEDITSVGKAKSKLKSKSKASTPSKDTKTKAVAKSRKLSLTDSASSDSLARPGKSPKTGGTVRSPRSQNSSTEFDTDSGSIIWPSSTSSSSVKIPSAKSKSKSSKKKTKEPKVKDSKKTGVKGQASSDPAADATMEAIENVIRKSCGSHGNEEKEMPRSGALQHALHVYEDDSDSPWETAMMDAKHRRNSTGQAQQKGLALLAGISSQELLKSTISPLKDAKAADGTTTEPDSSKKKSAKAKKRSASPASSEQETPKKVRKNSPLIIKKEKDFEFPSKMPKASKSDKKKDRTSSELSMKLTLTKQEKRESEDKPFFNEEIWTRRRSERIFLSDISPGPSRDASPLSKGHDAAKTPKKPSQQSAKIKASSEESGSDQGMSTDHNGVANIGSVLDALKTDTLQIRKKLASMSAQEDEKDEAPRKTKKKLSKKRDQGKKSSSKQDLIYDLTRTRHDEDILDSSCSEAENLPLSNLLDRQTPPAPRSCIINKEELENGLRVLTPIDGLFYAGYVNAIQPPDVYGVILDGERGNRPHVFSQEQMLQETFIDVKPLSMRYVPEGTRVCAYWSQQFRCLYPGTVVKGTPNPNEDPNFVCVEFDDGDSGRIPVDHIRMLPHDFPIVEFEPIPTELQRKRRRRTSEASSSAPLKPESMDTSKDTNASKAKTTSSKKKPKMVDSNKSAADPHEMDRISESGEDDVFLPHSQKVQSKSKKSKNHDKSKKLSSKADSKSKEKKKKKKRKREDRRHESSDRKRSKRSSSKSPRRSPARSPSRSPGKSKKKKRKEERKKKNSSKLNSSSGSKSPVSKSKSSKKKSSSSSSKRKSHRDERQSSFCTVETETVYSTHPITNSQALTEEESTSETPTCDGGKGAWSKHRGTRDHSMDEWSSTDSSKDSSSDSDETSSDSQSSKDNTPVTSKRKKRSSCLPSTSKMTAFLPARQLWNWFGKATQRRGAKGKARKVFYRAIMRENEIIRQGDAAVFLSTGRPQLPYIGRIESMWESWGGNMVVRVKWFYHPEETKGGRKSHDGKMALYQSLHVDENDVQTISHKCEVLSVEEYKRYSSAKKHKHTKDSEDVYYLAGTYDPTSGHITSVT